MADAKITSLLLDWANGDEGSLNTLTPLVYEQLHRIASNAFRGENAGHTLQATALVHEAFAKLVGANVNWTSRTHFYALAARMMRRILVDHANARGAAKRGGSALRVTLEDSISQTKDADQDVLDLHEALEALSKRDVRKADILELHFFGGLTYKEMGEVTGLSSSTLDRELRFAKAWLRAALEE